MRFLLPFLFSLSFLSAQSSVQDFRLGGYAQILNDECIRLTPDVQYVSGSAWYENAIDLNSAFELVVCLVLGEKDDEGADGIAFVFHPSMATGYRGEGMGFSGLVPSLGIEFDTYRNFHLDDPASDHVAIMPNGLPYHQASLLGPVEVPNLENGKKHLLRLSWNPLRKQLLVELDNEPVADYSADLVAEIFGNNSKVFWGVTAATGRLSNYQDICIKKLTYAAAQ
ncbi:hypothetical protein CEQ90_08175 [Lewinellaceae bacterium SD302]|nr:hypothetical protein CEQ90_08175 [Lewinellaceae bacterium SD302]